MCKGKTGFRIQVFILCEQYIYSPRKIKLWLELQVPLHPFELFKGLRLRPNGQIKDLWRVQIETLDIYYSKMLDLQRIAIELPTGSGKSIIALLILEMWRRAGKRIAILVSSIELGRDMARRCDDLGIPSAIITGRRDSAEEQRERIRNIRNYQRRKAIGIMNYWAYMWGRDIATPEVLVIDDADNFGTLLDNYYSLVVSKRDDPDIWNQIVANLKKYRIYQRLEMLEAHPRIEEAQLIYFPHAYLIADLLRRLIISKSREDISKKLYWSFQRNKERIHTYLMIVSGDELVLTPHIIPGSMHENLRDVDQIIYMSATLGSPEMIHNTQGSLEEITILTERDIESPIGTMGKRIIFPLTGIATSWRSLMEICGNVLHILRTFKKALILCNSYRDAYTVKRFLEGQGQKASIYPLESDSQTFAATSEGALITAGRFIGLDFPDEACRVEIITKMPYFVDPRDIIASNIMEDSMYVIERTSNRLLQAFGRCNRSPNDYAIYFVLDGRLADDALGDERFISYFPTRMKGEFDYGAEFTLEGGLDRAIEIGEKLLAQNITNFELEIAKRLEWVIERPQPAIETPYLTEIQAWYNLCERQSYLEAGAFFDKCIEYYSGFEQPNDLVDRKIAWMAYLSAMSYYLAYEYFKNDDYKKQVIEKLELSMKLGQSSWFSGLQLIINELKEIAEVDDRTLFDLDIQTFNERLIRSWQQFMRENSTRRRTPPEAWENLRRTLMEGTHNQVCDVLERVLELMGFEVRPIRQQTGEPDLLVFSDVGEEKYLCITEVKTKEQGSASIVRENVDQIHGHRSRYQREYPQYQVYPVLFTNKEEFSDTAVEKAKQNVRILRSAEFTTFMIDYFDLIQKTDEIRTPLQRLSLMERIPTTESFEIIFKPTLDPVVKLEEINSLLKR